MSRKLYEFYCKYPTIARSLTGATLFLTADLAGQQIILKKKEKNDYIATGLAAFIGLSSGTVLSVWYGYLERKFGPYDCFRPAINKTLLDQFIFAPIFIGIPLCLSDVREFKNPSEWFNPEGLEPYKDLMLSSYAYMPALMFLNFRFMDVRYRVVMTQVIGAVWWFAHTIKKEKGSGGGGNGGGGGGGGGKEKKKGGGKEEDKSKDSKGSVVQKKK